MKIESREDIRKLIIHIESAFDVNAWKIDDIHLWPYLRIKLFLSMVSQLEDPKPTTGPSEIKVKSFKKNLITREGNRIRNKYIRVKNVLELKKWLRNLQQKDHLFVGTDLHRVDYEKSRFNRFFDTFILNNNLAENYLYLEKGDKSFKPYFKPENISFYSEFMKIMRYNTKSVKYFEEVKICLNGYSDFIDFINSHDCTQSFVNSFNAENIYNQLKKIWVSLIFFNTILKKIKPKSLYVLCFYSDEFMFLLSVANKMGIKTIEYQHGPQSDTHLGYSNWNVVPLEGYSMLPRNYWCWNKQSTINIEKWTVNHALYNVELVGNFWVDYWKKQPLKMDESNFILYTLQPSPVKLEELFPPNLVEFIANNNHIWYLRLHPCQIFEKDKILSLIKSFNIIDKVNVEIASSAPLPLLLGNCKVHVTHFSGSTIEAEQMGKFTILINKLGMETFKDLVHDNMAIYIDPCKGDFELLLKEYLC